MSSNVGNYERDAPRSPLRGLTGKRQVSACAAITFIDDGSSTGVCVFPATLASIMSAHSCTMCLRCSAYWARL